MKQSNRRAILGLFLVLLGGFFLLNNLNLIPALPSWVLSWQMILIYIGIFNLFTGNRAAAIILVGLGGLFLLERYYYFDFRDWWPIILIVIGLGFIFRQKQVKTGELIDDNFFDSLNIFGGGKQQVSSHKLQGGRVTSIFGGAEIDLRDSKPVEGATIEVFSLFGGCKLMIPENWAVKSNVSPILGGFADDRKSVGHTDGPVIYIKGTVIMGGCELKS